MSRGYQPLNSEKIQTLANELSVILEKLPFDQTLSTELKNTKAKLENGAIVPQDYFDDANVKGALSHLKQHNPYLLPGLFRIWSKQPHAFSLNEKMLLTLSSFLLVIAAVLSHEFIVVFFSGKRSLLTTGNAIKDFCTSGLTSNVAQLCNSLPDGVTAVFDLNRKPTLDQLYSYMGMVNDTVHGPIPGNAIQSVHSWLDPIAWRNFFMCTKNKTTIEMIGHSYQGSITETFAKAKNSFPVQIVKIMLTSQNPVMSNLTLALMTQLFFASYCIMLDNGGYSAILDKENKPYGHFDGFERFGEDFQFNMYLFTIPYVVVTALSLLATGGLLIKKAISKYQDSSIERDLFWNARKACAIDKKFQSMENTHSPELVL